MAESSEITSRAPRAEITWAGVQPPSRVYLSLDDRLYIRSRNSLTAVTLRLAGRLLTPEGDIVPFNFEHTPATDRTASLESFQLGEGFLLSAVVFPSVGAPTRGQTFVELGFLRGLDAAASIVDVLAKDYVAENEPVAFPGSPIRPSVEGRGAIRSITGTDPAAGTEISETVPTDARWQVKAFAATFVSDATVANRFPSILFDDGTNTYFRAGGLDAHAASTTREYHWAPGLNDDVSRPELLTQALPIGLYLPAGHRIRSSTPNIVAGDNYGAPQFLVEEWLED